MLGTALVVFREVLEAALIISIVAAATRNVPGRSRWLIAGLAAGLAGAGAVAAGTEAIAEAASGIGQELFNALILGIAVLMLAWHNIWMASHGKAMAQEARSVGDAIREGRRACSVLLIVVGLAVLREGAETVLFLYGIASAGGSDASSMLAGGAIGVVAGVALGVALYGGLLSIPLRWFFAATSTLVLLLAAGLAAQAARFLVQADVLPALADPLWDTSGAISNESMAGTLLHGLIGYDAQPAGMQVLFYFAAAAIIWTGMRLADPYRKAPLSHTH